MPLVTIVTVLALIQYVVQGVRVGQARQRYGVEAPATTGHAIFERHFRVHQNTLEQLLIFLPGMWLFGLYVSLWIAALLGVVFIVARFIYERGYVADPNQRATGFVITAIVNGVLLIGALIGALVHL
ncbi:MAG: MAPEG family protein [Candidatus Binatia bacterium]|jgi:glutathione S-transferase